MVLELEFFELFGMVGPEFFELLLSEFLENFVLAIGVLEGQFAEDQSEKDNAQRKDVSF